MNPICAVCSQPVIRTPKMGWHHANPVTECVWGRPERPGVHLRQPAVEASKETP